MGIPSILVTVGDISHIVPNSSVSIVSTYFGDIFFLFLKGCITLILFAIKQKTCPYFLS